MTEDSVSIPNPIPNDKLKLLKQFVNDNQGPPRSNTPEKRVGLGNSAEWHGEARSSSARRVKEGGIKLFTTLATKTRKTTHGDPPKYITGISKQGDIRDANFLIKHESTEDVPPIDIMRAFKDELNK